MTRVAFLWHLHQPDYRDPRRGRPVLPFLRLHALRGYRDLLVETIEHGTRWTLNVVPSLLDQLLDAAAGVRDEVHDLTVAPPESLVSRPDARAMLPSGHPTMSAHPRYRELRARCEAGDALDAAEILDLQVWSVLAWFGATAVRDFPVIPELRRKGRGFDLADRAATMAAHDAVLVEIPGLLRRLPPGTVSCTPYFHPILPLLVDADHARRAMPHLPSTTFRHPEDALHQLVSARARVAEVCGVAPMGLWPSEGSVSPEVVALAAEAGFRWLCTDRGVLERSERTGGGEGPWGVGHGVVGLFRDTDLSDRIGFRYADRDPGEAATDLVTALRGRGTVLVALDGENPWESYADAGGAFRAALREALAAGPVTAVTVDDAASGPVVGEVTHLWSGSWIGADFRIWIGHDEDRRAWRLLGEARSAVEVAAADRRERALRHLYAAEGSDWFWWFGDDFRTPFAGVFDALFRAHLAAAWEALGEPVPDVLGRPIRHEPPPATSAPTRVLAIHDGAETRWTSWAGAGEIRPAEGAMALAHAIRRIWWGQDARGDTWVRAVGRGDLAPNFAGHHVRGDDGVTSRVAAGTPLSWTLPDGSVWPREAMVLPTEPRPDLAFWGP